MRLTLALSLGVLLLASCNFYIDTDECQYGNRGGVVRVESLRQPINGVCLDLEYFDQRCDESCGPCPAQAGDAPGPLPTWGACVSECTGLGEGLCVEQQGCRAIYSDEGYEACWQNDTGARIFDALCSELDAVECSMAEQCGALHEMNCEEEPNKPLPRDEICEIGSFLSCLPEPGYKDCLPIDVDCPAGTNKVCPPNGCEADCICEPI